MKLSPFRGVAIAAFLLVLLIPGEARAHWCNNIWAAPSRIVVKPEVTSVNVGGGGAKLRIYVQNNLPYTLFSVEMRGNASGYTISVQPSAQDIAPGQNSAFTFTISGGAGGKVGVDTLGLQMKFRPKGHPSSWFDESSECLINQNVDKATLAQGATGWWSSYAACGLKNQATSLNAATLHDKDPKATLPGGSPTLGRTGAEELIKLFGYRFCFTGSGSWRCGSKDCPGACAEGSPWANTNQFPQNCMRAGVDLAARKKTLGSALAAARAGATNALKGGCSLYTKPTQHKCLAAIVGAYLWLGAANTTSFTTAVKDGSNCVPKACQDAALRALTGSPKSTCSGLGTYEEEAACAAAEGLRDNDAPVKSLLLPKAGDGYMPSGGNYQSLYYAYMLYIVTAARRAQHGKVSYYPDAGVPLLAGDLGGGGSDKGSVGGDGSTVDSTAPSGDASSGDGGDDGCSCAIHDGHYAEEGGAIALVLLLLALTRKERQGHSGRSWPSE